MRWPWVPRARDSVPPVPSASDHVGRGDAHLTPDPTTPAHRPTRAKRGDHVPVWLLDVDGVLNAHRPGWGGHVTEGWAKADRGRFLIRWSPDLVAGIRDIDTTGAVEIRWATTWVPWIEVIEELLGLPHWPPAYGGPYEGSGTPATPAPWAKLDAALAVIEQEGRPLIWTDDDSIPTAGEELERLTAGPPPALLVRPDHRAGLQPEHLAEIAAFVRSLDQPRD